jgi:hypothetical protein
MVAMIEIISYPVKRLKVSFFSIAKSWSDSVGNLEIYIYAHCSSHLNL